MNCNTVILFFNDYSSRMNYTAEVIKETDINDNPKTTYITPDSCLVITKNKQGYICWDFVSSPGIQIDKLKHFLEGKP